MPEETFGGLAEAIVPEGDYLAARDEFVAAYRANDEARDDAKEAKARLDAAAEQLAEMMAARGEKMIRMEDGVSITQVEKEHFSCLKDRRRELLAWVPSEMHTVNARTLESYARSIAEVGEPLPDFITTYTDRRLQARGLRRERPGK